MLYLYPTSTALPLLCVAIHQLDFPPFPRGSGCVLLVLFPVGLLRVANQMPQRCRDKIQQHVKKSEVCVVGGCVSILKTKCFDKASKMEKHKLLPTSTYAINLQ